MELVSGEVYIVTPIKFEYYGAIVQLQDGSTKLIHLSEISDEFVRYPEDYISIGAEYAAKAVWSDRLNRLQLSLKHLGLPSQQEKLKSSDTPDSHSRKDNRHSNEPKTCSIQDQSMSLDEMIKNAQSAYNDKMKNKRRSNRKRR